MTRTDQLKAAINAVLEQNRHILDGSNPVRAIQLHVRLTADERIQGILFTPEIETVHHGRFSDRYVFQDDTR